MNLSQRQLELINRHQYASMVTVGPDGRPKVARVEPGIVDDRLWSNRGKVRTRRLRDDPRCTLLFTDEEGPVWLALETTVSILDGDDAPELNLRLVRSQQSRPSGPVEWFGSEVDESTFLETMRRDEAIVYQFTIDRCYGSTGIA